MKHFTPDKIAAIFKPNGPLHKAIPQYHYRQEQVSLAEAVANALVNHEFLVAEAGTGWKDPGLFSTNGFLGGQGRPTGGVATRTRALQQQIMDKDIPSLQKLCPLVLRLLN